MFIVRLTLKYTKTVDVSLVQSTTTAITPEFLFRYLFHIHQHISDYITCGEGRVKGNTISLDEPLA